jgi:hypothetical protein
MVRFRTLAAAGLAAAALAGATATAASAATPSAGRHAIQPYVKMFGRGYVLDAKGAGPGKAGQPLILWRASNSDPGQDFTPLNEGTVQDFRDAGLVSASFNLHYSKLPALELEYTPYGQGTDLCVGTWPGLVAKAGLKMRLEPCGEGANTVLAINQVASRYVRPGYVPDRIPFAQVLIAAGTNFSHPAVMQWPDSSLAPTDSPRPWLNVGNALTIRGRALDTQLWSYVAGHGTRGTPYQPPVTAQPAPAVTAAA